tara:strand:- start:124 stop:942 length:819 start_codon:yes stop_codon:yes gene_type:complete
MDNGSHRAESTISLRRISQSLSQHINTEVHPVSLLHSTKVNPSELEGKKAEILEPFIKSKCEKGVDSFFIIPFFFGQSAALKDYLPERGKDIKSKWQKTEIKLAPTLVKIEDKNDYCVSNIISELVLEKIEEKNLKNPHVTLVDHGTPVKEVNQVRNHISQQLTEILNGRVAQVKASSMERREGKEYEFNEPLLENLLGQNDFIQDVVLAMLFISPGRHAGTGGDIDKICQSAESKCNTLRTFKSKLFAMHPKVIDLLASRYKEGLESFPIV